MSSVVTIYCDGACRGNPGPGGWGAVITIDRGISQETFEINGSHRHTTNNRMEMLAAVKALEASPSDSEIHIYSDSQYVVNTMTKGWARKKNNDLWKQLDDVCADRNIQWHWVRGHNGDPLNERADRLAVQGIYS